MINATSTSIGANNQYSPILTNVYSAPTAPAGQSTTYAADSYSPTNPLFAADYDTAYPPAYVPSTAPPSQPVAAQKTSSVWGDPHIDTASGGTYEFHHPGTYNLLADKNVNLNAQIDGQPGKTFITQAGLTLGTRQLTMKADGSAQLGSGPFAIVLQDGQSIKLADGSTISRNGSEVTASTPEYQIVMKVNNNHQPHLNIDVKSKDQGVMADGAAPTGLLGESFNADCQKQNASLLDSNTYQRNGLFDSTVNAPTQALANQHLAEAKGQQTSGTPYTGNTNLMFMLQMISLLTNIFQSMFQLFGQGSSTRAA